MNMVAFAARFGNWGHVAVGTENQHQFLERLEQRGLLVKDGHHYQLHENYEKAILDLDRFERERLRKEIKRFINQEKQHYWALEGIAGHPLPFYPKKLFQGLTRVYEFILGHRGMPLGGTG